MRQIRSQCLRHVVAVLTVVFAVAGLSSPVAAQSAVDTLVHGLLVPTSTVKVHPPGEKDTADNLDAFRFGWAMWDTGEGTAGYWNEVKQLSIFGSGTYEGLPAEPDPDVLAPLLFSSPWIQFTPGIQPGTDESLAFGTTGVNFISVQNTIWSPQRLDTSGNAYANFETYMFPGVDGLVANHMLPTQEVRLSQDVGFANNDGFLAGEYELNVAHAIVTKLLNQSQTAHVPYAVLQSILSQV